MCSGVFCFSQVFLLNKRSACYQHANFWQFKYRSFWFTTGKRIHAQLFCLSDFSSSKCTTSSYLDFAYHRQSPLEAWQSTVSLVSLHYVIIAYVLCLWWQWEELSFSTYGCKLLWFRPREFYGNFSPLQQFSLAELKWGWENPTPNHPSIYKAVCYTKPVTTSVLLVVLVLMLSFYVLLHRDGASRGCAAVFSLRSDPCKRWEIIFLKRSRTTQIQMLIEWIQ